MTITKYWMIESTEFDDVLVEVIIPDPFTDTLSDKEQEQPKQKES